MIWGLLGEDPTTIDPDAQKSLFDNVSKSGELLLGGERLITFLPDRDIIFKPDELLPYHPNGMLFRVYDNDGEEVYTKQFYSIGGGFIVGQKTAEADQLIKDPVKVTHSFSSAAELMVPSASSQSSSQVVKPS